MAHSEFVDQRQYALQATKPDNRVHLEVSADVGSTLQHALFQRPLGPYVHVLRRKLLLETGHFANRLFQTAALRRQAVQQARLVQVNVRFHERGRYQCAMQVVDAPLGVQPGLDGCDAPARNPDVHQRSAGTVNNPGVAKYCVHASPLSANPQGLP